mgnify:CR=1 FL=1
MVRVCLTGHILSGLPKRNEVSLLIAGIWQIFNKFWTENPNILRKVVAVTGDVGNADLGLSLKDKRMLLNEVTVVFHVAATLKLDANLKDAINMNTEGTLRLLQLSCEMKNLVVSK